MRRILLLLSATVLLVTASYAQQDVESRIKRVEKGLLPPVLLKGEPGWALDQRMKHYNVPGLGIAVINNFQIEWARSYGVKDATTNEPVTEQTLFQSASISKPVNATAILKRVQDGKLSLDENVNTYLHSWNLPDNEFTAKRKVTIANLLSHTGGTTVSGFPGYDVTATLPTVQQILKGEAPANTRAIIVDMEPGVRARYSGGGTTILQLVLMELEKKPYPQIMKELVLDPLRMTHSSFNQPLPEDWQRMAATAHRPNDKPVKGKFHVYPEMAAAGLWTTPSDLAKFAMEHQLSLQGKSDKILSRETEEKMMTPYISDASGLGFSILVKGKATYFQHSGGNEGFNCFLIAHKDKGYGAVVMINCNAYPIIPEIVNSIVKEYLWEDYLPAPYEIFAVAPEKLKRYTDRYLLDADRVVKIEVEGNHLSADVTRVPRLELYPLSESEFIRRDQDTRVTFVEGADPSQDALKIVVGGSLVIASRIGDDRRIPYEYLAGGDVDGALSRYRAIKKSQPSDPSIQENRLNQLGYELMGQNKLAEAIAIFTLNTELYPESWNVYDSLGEAYMNKGDRELAIRNYKKSLELNPNNTGAVEAIKKLMK